MKMIYGIEHFSDSGRGSVFVKKLSIFMAKREMRCW